MQVQILSGAPYVLNPNVPYIRGYYFFYVIEIEPYAKQRSVVKNKISKGIFFYILNNHNHEVKYGADLY